MINFNKFKPVVTNSFCYNSLNVNFIFYIIQWYEAENYDLISKDWHKILV